MSDTPAPTFGDELKRERLIREISLEEISSATKISLRLLTALESSDMRKLPAPVFTRGFIRSYSRCLGIDPEEMVNAYIADLAPEKSREAMAPRRGRPLSRFLRGRRATAGTIVVSVSAVLLLLGLIARPERRAAAPSVAAVRAVEPVAFKNVAVSPLPAVAPRVEPAISVEPAAPAAMSLELEFQEESWTELTADGEPVFTGLIKRGTKRRFEAREGFRLTLGNAGGVRVTVDGQALERLGGAGQVVRLQFPQPRPTQS